MYKIDCIEQYLDHIGRINLGYEIRVKNHYLFANIANKIYIKELNEIDVI